MNRQLLLTSCLLVAVNLPGFAQTKKEQLQNERKNIQSELAEIRETYNQVRKKGTRSLAQLNMLKRKISLQERYINNINHELQALDDDIYHSNLEIYRLQKQYDTLKAQYARSVVAAYKDRSSFSYVNFIFSATGFNDALRRIAYLKDYRANRERQARTIQETYQLINNRQQQQLARKEQKNEALKEQTEERNTLAEQRKEKDQVLAGLKSREKELQRQIAAKKKRDRQIQSAIAVIIRREIDAAQKEEAKRMADAKKAAAESKAKKETVAKTNTRADKTSSATAEMPAERPVTGSVLELNKGDIALGTDFGRNKGKLPWPVDNGFVKIPFGKFTVDGTPLEGMNPGLTLGTKAGAPVKAVFDGVVSGVHNYGDGAAIIVRHGKYYTSYANLSGVNVSKGAVVKRGQTIGKAGESDDGAGGSVDFMLLIESNNVNPQSWLRR